MIRRFNYKELETLYNSRAKFLDSRVPKWMDFVQGFRRLTYYKKPRVVDRYQLLAPKEVSGEIL
jgi:hypothetical protein